MMINNKNQEERGYVNFKRPYGVGEISLDVNPDTCEFIMRYNRLPIIDASLMFGQDTDERFEDVSLRKEFFIDETEEICCEDGDDKNCGFYMFKFKVPTPEELKNKQVLVPTASSAPTATIPAAAVVKQVPLSKAVQTSQKSIALEMLQKEKEQVNDHLTSKSKSNKLYFLFNKSMHTLEIKGDIYPHKDFLKEYGFFYNDKTKSYTRDEDIGPDLIAYPYMSALAQELSLKYKIDIEQKDVFQDPDKLWYDNDNKPSTTSNKSKSKPCKYGCNTQLIWKGKSNIKGSTGFFEVDGDNNNDVEHTYPRCLKIKKDKGVK